jgi:quinoprotein glucose dehydrogenase
VPIRNAAMVASLLPPDPAKTNWNWVRAPTAGINGPQDLPILKPPYSFVTATDMNRGEHLWSRPIGGASKEIRNHPALQGLALDFDNMGQPGVRPSPLLTKTLLFLAEAGNLGGDPGGPMFRAYDKRSGAVLAEIELPERATGAPMTFLHQGRQYIVIAVGSQSHPAELVALALPGARRPGSRRLLVNGRVVPGPPIALPIQMSAAQRARARGIYDRSCAACHGPNGAGLNNAPALRNASDFGAVVAKIKTGGVEMPPMATLLDDEEIDVVARFVAAGM